MVERIVVVAGLLVLLAACSGPETEGEVVEVVEVEAVVAETVPEKPRPSGAERKRNREAQAEFAQGFDLLFGRAGVHDPVQAHLHLLKAAELGHARSQSLVGVNYQKGRGTQKNPDEAIKWLLLAAENGWAHAQMKVGEAYRDGQGVEQDRVEAVKWLALSSWGGSIAGSMIASSYAASLPRAERLEGIARARAWRVEHGLPIKPQAPGENAVTPVLVPRSEATPTRADEPAPTAAQPEPPSPAAPPAEGAATTPAPPAVGA